MTRAAIGFVVGLGILVSASAWTVAQSGRSALEGAWVLQDWSYAKQPAPVRVNKPTGLMLFVGNHYSLMFLRDSARPEVGFGGEGATADQLRAAWGPLQANAGTFQVAGNSLTMRGSVAKGVPPMTPGNFREYMFMLTGDTLVLTSTRTQDGPAANPATYRLTRAK